MEGDYSGLGSGQWGTEFEHRALSSLASGPLTICFPPVLEQEMAGAERGGQGFPNLTGFWLRVVASG